MLFYFNLDYNTVFLTAASCPKKDFNTPTPPPTNKKAKKKMAKKAAKKFIPEPVLLLS